MLHKNKSADLSKIVAHKIGINVNVNMRILRRLQISAIWQEETNPTWVQKVAIQAGHSFATASKYYDYSLKDVKGCEVVERLCSMRKCSAPVACTSDSE